MNTETLEPAAATELQDIAEIRDGSAVVKLNRTEAGLSQLRADLAGKSYDLATVKGDKEARSDRLRCVSLRANVEKLRKSLKAPALEFGRLIDSEAKRITDAVESLESPIDSAIKADEARREDERQAKARAEAARLAGLRDVVAAALGKWVERSKTEGISAARIAAGIEMMEDLSPQPEWREVNDFWQSAKAQTLATMRGLHDSAQRREDAARLDAQRIEQERQAAIQRQQAEGLAKQRAELEAQAQALRDEAARMQRAREQEAARIAAQQAESERLEALAVAKRAALQKMEDAGAAILAAAPKVADYLPISAPAVPYVAPAAVVARPATTAAEPATLNLGAICTRLGFTVTADFLADSLGIAHSRTDKASRLYRESDWPRICAALVHHIGAVCELQAA